MLLQPGRPHLCGSLLLFSAAAAADVLLLDEFEEAGLGLSLDGED